jgi:hypothetical protein
MIKKPLVVSLFVVQGLPLLIYPFVLLANIMSLEGNWGNIGNDQIIVIIIIIITMITSTFYPLIYLLSVIYYFNKRSKVRGKVWVLFAPLFDDVCI